MVLVADELVELLFFELLNEVHGNLHRRRAQPVGAGCANSIYPACGFGAAIRQSPGFVTRLSCFLAAFGRLLIGPQIRPPRPGQGLGLGPTPGRDLGMVAGNQDFRDRPALEHLRPGVLGVFQ